MKLMLYHKAAEVVIMLVEHIWNSWREDTARAQHVLAILYQGVKRAIFMRVKELRLHRNKFAHLTMPDELKGTVFQRN